jgi:putative acyl-CoA dehydrogenase
MCLDVLRAMAKHPRSVEFLMAEIEPAFGRSAVFDRWVSWLKDELQDSDAIENRARRLVQDMALALQGALLLRFAPDHVAQAFCATRLAGDWGYAFGTLPKNTDFESILERAWPEQ